MCEQVTINAVKGEFCLHGGRKIPALGSLRKIQEGKTTFRLVLILAEIFGRGGYQVEKEKKAIVGRGS